VNIAKRVVPQLISYGTVRRARLGISTKEVKDLVGQVQMPVSEGVMIIQVAQGGAASNAGLRGLSQTVDGDIILGDIITAVNGQRISGSDDLYKALDKYQIGDQVSVEIVRNGRRTTVPVKLVEVPDQRRGVFRR
jgi:S1-C subfamily serine protease